jgi:hypothetical protein
MADLTPEDRAEAAARDIDFLPPGAGTIGMIRQAVSDARREGRASMLREVVDAYGLFIDTDDLDGFRDTLTNLMDAEGVAACPVVEMRDLDARIGRGESRG